MEASAKSRLYARCASLCFSIIALWDIISAIVEISQGYRSFTVFSMLWWIVFFALAGSLFFMKKNFFAIAVGAAMLFYIYILGNVFNFFYLLTFLAYAAMLATAVLAMKENKIAAKIWFAAAALRLLACLINVFGHLEYFRYLWSSDLQGLIEVAALAFAGLWFKDSVQSEEPVASYAGNGQAVYQSPAPQLRFNESMSATAQFAYNQKRTELSANGAEIDEETEAKLFAQAVELQTLKAPASAQFCSLEQMTVVRTINGAYSVTGFVDSQNSYGAMLRNTFTLNVCKSNGEWKSVDVFVDSTLKSTAGIGGVRALGIVLMLVSAGLDIVSMIMIQTSDYDMFNTIITVSSITFFIGLIMTIAGRVTK